MRLLLVEDEPPIARRIEKMVRELLGERLAKLQVVETLLDAERFLAGDCIDLLLLDLNLHGASGFVLLEQAVAGSFHTVVVSANTDQALRAFEYGVLDFVPKPVTADRFRLALARVTDVRARSEFAARTLAVQKHGRVVLVAVDDVSYVKGAGAYSELVLTSGKRELHGKSIEKLLAVLPPHFERVHKSYIIDMRRVKTFHVGEGSRYEAELNNGECLPIGRERWKEIRARLK
jgi:two-component system response regulator LytT